MSFWTWFGILASAASITSLTLYVLERHRREKQEALVLGFLRGVKAQAWGMAQAGEEWRWKVAEKPAGYAMGFANAATNAWISLDREINRVLLILDPEGSGGDVQVKASRPNTESGK